MTGASHLGARCISCTQGHYKPLWPLLFLWDLNSHNAKGSPPFPPAVDLKVAVLVHPDRRTHLRNDGVSGVAPTHTKADSAPLI